MKQLAFVDLAILAIVFWAVWSLRFLGVENIGLWTMLAGVTSGLALLRWRGQPLSSIGLIDWRQPRQRLSPRVLGAAGVIGLTTFGGAALLIPLLGPLDAGSAITNQPETLAPFLIDIVLGVWLGAALGEEVFFRGLLLSRFMALFGTARYGRHFAVLAQAVWFGSGHASQGLTGMVLTGVIGLGLAYYYLYRCRGNLLPLIIAHGLVDTAVLSVNFFSSG